MHDWAHPRGVWDNVFFNELNDCRGDVCRARTLPKSCTASAGAPLNELLLLRVLRLTVSFFQNFYMAGIAFNLIFIRVGAHQARLMVEEERHPSSHGVSSSCQDTPALHMPNNLTFDLVDGKKEGVPFSKTRCSV